MPLKKFFALQRNHVMVTGKSCKKDEAVISRSAMSNICNEKQTDAKGTTQYISCAPDMSPTSSSCEIIEIRIVESGAKDSLNKKEIEIEGGILGKKNPSADATKSAKKREDNSTFGSNKVLKRCNTANCLKFETNQQEIKFRTTPINLFNDECAFCHSFRTTEVGNFFS
jgi:hypothetical protein